MSRRRRTAIAFWFALFSWGCAILWLSSLRPDELPDAAFMFWDKVNHFLAFTLGGWLAAGALRTSVPTAANTRVVILAVILVAVFGFADEMLQTITPDRSGANIYDWAADVLGALTGALLSLTTHRLSFRFSKERQ